MAREPGAASQLNVGSGVGDGSAPRRPRAAGLPGGGALRRFRRPPSPAEPSRTQPSPAEPRARAAAAARAPPSKRASGRGRGGGAAPGGGGTRSPQTARGRGRHGPAAAGAASGGCAARGRVGGGDVAPTRLPRPQPSGFRASVGGQHLAALDPPTGVHRSQLRLRTAGGHLCCPGIIESAERTASSKDRLYLNPASAWALPLRQPRCWSSCPCWSEGAAHHGGSHFPGCPHRHRLQWPGRLLATAALGDSLLGLPFPLC